MIKSIVAIATAIGAMCGLLSLLYKHWWSPKAKRRRKALRNGHKAVNEGDASGITSAFDKLRRRTLPIILLFIMGGCQAPIVLHPIRGSDIVRVRQGENIKAPTDGYFISDFYLKAVMDAKVD